MNLIEIIKNFLEQESLEYVVTDFNNKEDCKRIRELYSKYKQGNNESWNKDELSKKSDLMYLAFSLEKDEIYMYWASGAGNSAKDFIADDNPEYQIVSNKLFKDFFIKYKKKKLEL